jgi:fatty acid amide hydrolase 2
MDPQLTMSGIELAAQIRTGATSSVEVVEAHIRRIETVNPTINAVVADRFTAARAEAAAADRLLREEGAEAVGPLHGVPCTIKECFRLTGMPNSSGLVARRGVRSAGDATAVARLRSAGAIPLGVTNLSELCMWYESSNKVYGRTNNPYDPTRIVGGSSGGEGAIIGAGGSPLGLGSDIGGSIRMPAFFNGVFGHKGSSGLVPNTGQFPIAQGAAGRFLSTGPLCRRAEDLMPLLRILAGPDGEDEGVRPIVLGDPAAVSLSGMRVLVAPSDGRFSVSEELTDALRAAAGALADRGAIVEELDVARFRQGLEIWFSMLGVANEHPFRDDLFVDRPETKLRWELLRWLVGRSPHTTAALGLCVLERIGDLIEGNLEEMVERGEALRAELGGLLAGNTVLLYPPHRTVAPPHRVPLIRPLNFVYTALFNVMQLPVTQVPLGLGPGGMPVGVQVVGADGQDHRTIAAACALEEALGGWQPPDR